jgi:hypothetical protein
MADDDGETQHMDQAALSDRMTRLEEKLDQLLASGHKKAEAREEAHLDRPSTVEEQVRAELQRAEQERAAAASAADEKTERETIKAQLAALAETPPAQPTPRRTRLMWGGR